MQVVAIIGAIALAASVFLFFFTLWGRMSVGLQVTVLVAAPLWTVALAEIAARWQSLRFLTWLLVVVAFACFVLIWMLGDSPDVARPAGAWRVAAALAAHGQPLLSSPRAACRLPRRRAGPIWRWLPRLFCV
jgi:hypothetical protein